MAAVVPSTTPNPDAMKFSLDVTLPGMIDATTTGDTPESAFVAEVLAVDGVAAVFGVNDFVTVTRVSGADWEPIIEAVRSAAGAHL